MIDLTAVEQCLDPEVVEEYFKLLKKTVEENGLMNFPRRLYNCEETFLLMDEEKSLLL